MQRPSVVVLLHTLPDSTSHFDLLIRLFAAEASQASTGAPQAELDAEIDAKTDAKNDAEIRDLLAFRCPQRPDRLEPGARLELERLADHRRLYLDYEGPIAGDRGVVRRVAVGDLRHATLDESRGELLVQWNDATGLAHLSLRRHSGANWSLLRGPGTAPSSAGSSRVPR